MRPEMSGDLDDSGAEEISLAQFEEVDADILDVGLSPQNVADAVQRDAPQTKVDANFFNKFDDDFDESDMKPLA